MSFFPFFWKGSKIVLLRGNWILIERRYLIMWVLKDLEVSKWMALLRRGRICKCDCETILDDQAASQSFQTLSFSVGWIQVQLLQRRAFLSLFREEYAHMPSFWASPTERQLKVPLLSRCSFTESLFSEFMPTSPRTSVWRVLSLLCSISVKCL